MPVPAPVAMKEKDMSLIARCIECGKPTAKCRCDIDPWDIIVDLRQALIEAQAALFHNAPVTVGLQNQVAAALSKARP